MQMLLLSSIYCIGIVAWREIIRYMLVMYVICLRTTVMSWTLILPDFFVWNVFEGWGICQEWILLNHSPDQPCATNLFKPRAHPAWHMNITRQSVTAGKMGSKTSSIMQVELRAELTQRECMSSQHPSPNVKNPLRLRTPNWPEMITSRDATRCLFKRLHVVMWCDNFWCFSGMFWPTKIASTQKLQPKDRPKSHKMFLSKSPGACLENPKLFK